MDARPEPPDPAPRTKLIKRAEVEALTGLARSAIYHLMRRGPLSAARPDHRPRRRTGISARVCRSRTVLTARQWNLVAETTPLQRGSVKTEATCSGTHRTSIRRARACGAS